MDYLSFALGFFLGVGLMASWAHKHLRVANRIIAYSKEHDTIDGFDWEDY